MEVATENGKEKYFSSWLELSIFIEVNLKTL